MSQAEFSVSLITPTYNERENIALLAEELFGAVEGATDIDLELIVVDDNSPDGTGEAAEALTERFPVRVVHREGKLGLGSAVMAGFAQSQRPYLGVIDADLSHDPVEVPRLVRNLKEFDITIGSRFGETSQVERWALHRQLISKVGVGLARAITGVEDPLAGYFFIRRSVLGADFALTSTGYKILLEVLTKGTYSNHISLPIIFRNRQFSASKLNWREHVLFLKQIVVFGLNKMFGQRQSQ